MLKVAFPLILLYLWIGESAGTLQRTGEAARQLTAEDIAGLELVLPRPAKPWLIDGELYQLPDRQFVMAFLPPTIAIPELRGGTVVDVVRATNPRGPWTVESELRYAQVAIPGRDFDQIEGDQDINRPFRVLDAFDDGELVRIIKFVRSLPPVPEGWQAITPAPVLSLSRQRGDLIRIMLRGGVGRGQMIVVRPEGRGWKVVSAGEWLA